MVNLSVCASVIPDGLETTSDVSSSVYPLTTKVTNYLAAVLTEGSLTRWNEDAILRWLVRSRIRHMTACRILVFRHYTTCPRDCTYGLLPSDSIFYQLVVSGCT